MPDLAETICTNLVYFLVIITTNFNNMLQNVADAIRAFFQENIDIGLRCP